MLNKRRIEQKVRPVIFERILNQEKFSVLCPIEADLCECDIGDVLVLQEWSDLIGGHTGRSIEKTIINILETAIQFFPQTHEEKHNFQTLLF